MLREICLVILAVLVLAEATLVKDCPKDKSFNNIKSVNITNCENTPCKLKRRTRVAIQQNFIPDHDVESLHTAVQATILSVPFPFIGVDGTDACKNIYTADDKKAGCPLKSGTEYVYKNEFPILDFYPKINLVVRWALWENGKPVTCFEAPSKITS